MSGSTHPISSTRASAAVRPWQPLLATAATYEAVRQLSHSAGQPPPLTSPGFDLAGEVVAAIIVGATLTTLAPRLAGSTRSRSVVLGLLLFASVAAVMLEGSAFAPSLSPLAAVPFGLAPELVVSLVSAGVAVALSPASAGRDKVRRRPLGRLAPRLGVAALVYVVSYLVSGAIAFSLVTGPYYAVHAGGLQRPDPSTVLGVASVEGLLMTLGALPLARALGGARWSRALACGLALWLLGGVVPLLQQPILPEVVRLASAVEILFQKVPLGIAVVWLLASTEPSELRPRAARPLAEAAP